MIVVFYNDNALLQMFTLIITFIDYNGIGYNINII